MTDHIHDDETLRSANGKLVCDICVTKADKQGNECYCTCHTALKDQCPKCARFHRG
jgi:hypothetical protein